MGFITKRCLSALLLCILLSTIPWVVDSALSDSCVQDFTVMQRDSNLQAALRRYEADNAVCLGQATQRIDEDVCDAGLGPYDSACQKTSVEASFCAMIYDVRSLDYSAQLKRDMWYCLPTECTKLSDLNEIRAQLEAECATAGQVCTLEFRCAAAGHYASSDGDVGMSVTTIVALAVIGSFLLLLIIALAVVIPRRRRQHREAYGYSYREQGQHMQVMTVQAGWTYGQGPIPGEHAPLAMTDTEYPQPGAAGPPVNEQGMPVAFIAAGEDGSQTIYVPTLPGEHPAHNPPKLGDSAWPS